jgi:hypothetical protein
VASPPKPVARESSRGVGAEPARGVPSPDCVREIFSTGSTSQFAQRRAMPIRERGREEDEGSPLVPKLAVRDVSDLSSARFAETVGADVPAGGSGRAYLPKRASQAGAARETQTKQIPQDFVANLFQQCDTHATGCITREQMCWIVMRVLVEIGGDHGAAADPTAEALVRSLIAAKPGNDTVTIRELANALQVYLRNMNVCV